MQKLKEKKVGLNWKVNKPIKNELMEVSKGAEKISATPGINKFKEKFGNIIDIAEIELPGEKKKK